MSFTVKIGERIFETPSYKEDDEIAKIVDIELQDYNLSIVSVKGFETDSYIGGVSRQIANGIRNALHTKEVNIEVEDIQNTEGVSDTSNIVFKAKK